MAAGDVTVFDQAGTDLGNKLYDMDTDTFKMALVTNVVTPTQGDAGPHFGGTGTTNYATNEVTAGGNYVAGGVTLTSVTWAMAAGVNKWDAADVSIAQHASNPTNARWGIIYDSTDVNKRAIAFLDLGAVKDLSAGLFTVTWAATGIAGG